MGNRATVIFTDGKKEFSPAVYLHWNGGPESVYAFLEELDRRKQRNDQNYECARFIQLVGEFFDQEHISSTSLGVSNGPKSDDPKDLNEVMTDHGGNGFYLVNRTGKKMTVRRFYEHHEGENKYTMVEAPADAVAKEKRAAKKHRYNKDIRESFLKIQGTRTISEFQ